MATRRETDGRKARLRAELRMACLDGAAPGDVLPPITELAERYDISVNVVRQTVQGLVEEGILYTVPRVGTFVGRPPAAAAEFYLVLLPDLTAPLDSYEQQIRSGFEARVAQLGGSCLVMSLALALECRQSGELPALAGIFQYSSLPVQAWPVDGTVPCITFLDHDGPETCDRVSFDDHDGGRQATQHLLRMGRGPVAFLGLHNSTQSPQLLGWSAARESGWREALAAEGWPDAGLSFHPTEPFAHDRQREAAFLAARQLVRRSNIASVVTANDHAARGLFDCLREAGIPVERWPSIVSFDDTLGGAGYLVTSLRLPWQEIGRDAADVLWDRRHGRLTGPPVHRCVPMRLIPRLTCRMNWTQVAGASMLSALQSEGSN